MARKKNGGKKVGATYLSPGVYVEEVSSGSKPIEGVGTAVAAFVGLAERRPVRAAVTALVALSVVAAAIASLAGRFSSDRWRVRPFRAPHHTASGIAIVGGGSHARPGEISLAHHGVLFLDELPEWDRRVLEVLREPLESGVINISRAARQSTFPAQFQLVAAMNPCPCGWYGHPGGRCRCGPDFVRRYRSRISGPLLDRIDLAIDVPAVPASVLEATATPAAESPAAQARVVAVRERQVTRQGKCNARLSAGELALCDATPGAMQTLTRAMSRMQLSARAFHRVLKVARTIADLAGDARVEAPHAAEALAYRRAVVERESACGEPAGR